MRGVGDGREGGQGRVWGRGVRRGVDARAVEREERVDEDGEEGEGDDGEGLVVGC